MPWLGPSTTSTNSEESKIEDEPPQGEEAQVPTDSFHSQEHPQSYSRQPRPNLFEFSLVSWNCRSLNQTKSSYIQTLGADIYCLQESRKPKPEIQLAWQPCDIIIRNNKGGGGTVTAYPQDFVLSREYRINKDSNLYRFIVHGQRILWIANIYLNRGRITQVQKTFRIIQENIPPEEWQSFIGIGDWNVGLAQEDSRTKLIH